MSKPPFLLLSVLFLTACSREKVENTKREHAVESSIERLPRKEKAPEIEKTAVNEKAPEMEKAPVNRKSASISLPSLSSKHAHTLYELRRNYRQPDEKGAISIPIKVCDKTLKTDYSSAQEEDPDNARVDCFLTDLAEGSGAQLSVIHDCGEHLCRVERYIFASGLDSPAHLSAGIPLQVELSFDHRSVLVSSIMKPFISQASACPACEASPWLSYEINLTTFKTRPFSPCFSLTLSPRLDGYACRDDKGNVLSVPLSGGPTTLKVEAELAEGEEIVLYGPFTEFPTPVTFLSPSEIEFYLEIENRGTIPVGGDIFSSRIRRAAW